MSLPIHATAQADGDMNDFPSLGQQGEPSAFLPKYAQLLTLKNDMEV